jgi:hypothetical protein
VPQPLVEGGVVLPLVHLHEGHPGVARSAPGSRRSTEGNMGTPPAPREY